MRGVVILLFALLTIPSVIAATPCTYQVQLSGCEGIMCDKGETMNVIIQYQYDAPGEICKLASELKIELSSFDGSCEIKDGEEMPTIRVPIPEGLGSQAEVSTFTYTFNSDIPQACQGDIMSGSITKTKLTVDGNEVSPTRFTGNPAIGTNIPIDSTEIDVALVHNCSTGPCTPSNQFWYQVVYPKHSSLGSQYETRQKLFDVVAPIVTNGSNVCTFSEDQQLGSPANAFVIYPSVAAGNTIWDGNCIEQGDNWNCTTKKKNFPTVTAECSGEEMFISTTKLLDGNSSCGPGVSCIYNNRRFAGPLQFIYRQGLGSFEFPEASCRVKSFTIEDGDCDKSRLGNRCAPGDELNFEVELEGSSCLNNNYLLLYDNTAQRAIVGGPLINLSYQGQSGGVYRYANQNPVVMPALPSNIDYIPITRIKGYDLGGGEQFNSAAFGLIRVYTGPCTPAVFNTLYGDPEDSFIAPGYTGSVNDEAATVRLWTGMVSNSIVGLPWYSGSNVRYALPVREVQYCAPNIPSFAANNYTCQPGDELHVFFGLTGDCSEVETTEIELTFMEESNLNTAVPNPGFEVDWSNGTNAGYCFPGGKLRTFRDDDLYRQLIDSREKGLNPYYSGAYSSQSVLDPLHELSWTSAGSFVQTIPSIHEDCLNEYVWPETLKLYDNSHNEIASFDFAHNKFYNIPVKYSAGSYFKLGDRTGEDVERYCPEVWDDSGVKLLNSSCYMFEDSSGNIEDINTWTSPEISGKCPTDEYCLWIDEPKSEGVELPSAGDEGFWSNVRCVAPGETVISTHFGQEVELQCMGKRQIAAGPPPVRAPIFGNPFCPAVASLNAQAKYEFSFTTYNGYCTTTNQLCDSGVSSSLSNPVSISGNIIEPLICDQDPSVIHDDFSAGGLTERCYKSAPPNNATNFPKLEACCPLIQFPIVDDASNTQTFYFYDFQEIKIY